MFHSALSLLGLLSILGASNLHVDGEHFKDAQNRVVVLRGVNLSGDSKVPPFVSVPKTSLRPLTAWGINVVRLLFTWEAFEPTPGTYNKSYLDYYADLVRQAGEQGLYVIVDFHQDGMSRYLLGGCGDGFPGWALPLQAAQSTPDNGGHCANWPIRMALDTDMHFAWQQFYRNGRHVRQRYVEMTRLVASRVANEPAVLGYDMLNEPWGDEASEIGALYNDVAAAIRTVDAKAILFVSPHAIVSGGVQSDLAKPSFDNVVYAPHFYDNWVMGLQMWIGNSLDWSFAKMRAKAAQWNAPLFIGEFGAPANVKHVEGYMQTLNDRLNEGVTSGAQWCYTPGWTPHQKDGWNSEDLSIIDNDGIWRANFKPRPYPQKIAGTPVTLSVSDAVDTRANVFDFAWENDPAAGATEIFMPQPVFLSDEPMEVQTFGNGLRCTMADGGLQLRCASPEVGVMRVRVGAHGGYAAAARR